MSDFVQQWITTDGNRVRIRYDADAESPRDWDNVGTIACWHRRYEIGDTQPEVTPNEFLATLPPESLCIIVWMLDHSGITLRPGRSFLTGEDDGRPEGNPFHEDPQGWDSGPLGLIYVTPETMREQMIDTIDAARTILVGELDTYSAYLKGECYYYTLDAPVLCDYGDTHWEVVETIGGLIGYESLDEVKAEFPARKENAGV